jgi:hypothetical protein
MPGLIGREPPVREPPGSEPQGALPARARNLPNQRCCMAGKGCTTPGRIARSWLALARPRSAKLSGVPRGPQSSGWPASGAAPGSSIPGAGGAPRGPHPAALTAVGSSSRQRRPSTTDSKVLKDVTPVGGVPALTRGHDATIGAERSQRRCVLEAFPTGRPSRGKRSRGETPEKLPEFTGRREYRKEF